MLRHTYLNIVDLVNQIVDKVSQAGRTLPRLYIPHLLTFRPSQKEERGNIKATTKRKHLKELFTHIVQNHTLIFINILINYVQLEVLGPVGLRLLVGGPSGQLFALRAS